MLRSRLSSSTTRQAEEVKALPNRAGPAASMPGHPGGQSSNCFGTTLPGCRLHATDRYPAPASPAAAHWMSLSYSDCCTGTGNLVEWYASTVSGCNDRAMDCYWDRAHGLGHNGQGWVYQYNPTCESGPGQALNPTYDGWVYHNLCHAGGPCSGNYWAYHND